MENKNVLLEKTNKIKISQKTKQQNEAAHAVVIKLVNNNSSNLNRDDYHFRLKMLEFNGLKTHTMLKKGLSATEMLLKERLKHSSLNNKQKAEVLLVAEMEAYKVVDGLLRSIDEKE